MPSKPACLLMAVAVCLSQSVASWTAAAPAQKPTHPAPSPSPTPTKPAEQDQVIKVNTELVEVRAVVTDKQGQIVRGLQQEDFELLENNKPQAVSFFSIARIAGHDRSAPGAPTTTAPPKTSRERLAESPARTVVLFVDTLHLSIGSLMQVKQALRHFIEEQLTEQDLVALVSSAGTLGLVEQLTRNRQILRYAIERLTPGPVTLESLFTPYLAAQVERGDPEALNLAIDIMKQEEMAGGDRRTLENFARSKARQVLAEASYQSKSTLLTLKAVAERMAGLPGQRLIALFSDGFTLYDYGGQISTGDLQAAVSRAVRAGVAIYAIDAKGLQPPSMFSAAMRGGVMNPRLFGYQSDAEKDLENGLNALARDTGGEPFFNTNDLRGALEHVFESNSLYYVLAYYPAEEGKSTQFRRLTIRVKNHPEYTVRTPKGYLPSDLAKAKKDEAAATPQQRLVEAMLAPLSQSEIGVSASADYLESEMDSAQVTVRVQIQGDKLEYHEQNQQHSIALEMVTMIYDSNGKRVDAKSETVQGSIQPDRLGLAKQGGYTYVRRVPLKPGLYQARIGVRELSTGHVGTAAAWVEVPNLAQNKLTMSSLLLLDALAENSQVSKTPGGTNNNILPTSKVTEGIRFYPRGQFCAYFFRLYHTKASANEVVMQTEFMQGGKSIAQSPWQPVSARQIGEDRKGIMIGGQIQLEGLKPGIYEIRMTVKDPQSKRTVQRTAPFGVE